MKAEDRAISGVGHKDSIFIWDGGHVDHVDVALGTAHPDGVAPLIYGSLRKTAQTLILVEYRGCRFIG